MNKFIGSFANKTGSIYDLWECDDRYNLIKSGTDKNEVHCAYSDIDWLFKMKGFAENPYNE